MPANRLRNLDWQRSLRQVHERGGSLDVTIAPADRARSGPHANLLWRVRLLSMTESDFTIEQPTSLGHAIGLADGVEVVVLLTIGQNRWMFRTTVRGTVGLDSGGGRSGRQATTGVILTMPTSVERCQRRANYRVSTAELNLPAIDAWPLLDPKSVILAERANELAVKGESGPAELHLPEVGPRFSATLLNLGGGGVGLQVNADQSQSLLRHKLFWLRVELASALDAPICATAKLVHTHLTANQDYYAGMAFDFTFNPAHQDFVVEQIGRYVASIQRSQMLRRSA